MKSTGGKAQSTPLAWKGPAGYKLVKIGGLPYRSFKAERKETEEKGNERGRKEISKFRSRRKIYRRFITAKTKKDNPTHATHQI